MLFRSGKPAHLVVRSAPEGAAHVHVRIDGVEIGLIDLARTEAWVECSTPLSGSDVREGARVDLVNDGPADFIDYHAWLTQ